MDVNDEDIKKLTEMLTEYIVNNRQNNKWDGKIAQRPSFKGSPELKKLFFGLTNKTVSNKWCLPKRTGRIMDILRNTQYTYIEAVAASVIDMALEGNIAAAKLVLYSTCKDNSDGKTKASEDE